MHQDELVREFGVSQTEAPGIPMFYGECISILDLIIRKVAQDRNEDEIAVWKRFKRGMFTGEMMHLRDIEHAFGRGSLRVLAALNWESNHTIPIELIPKIKEYFDSDDDEKRDEIAKEVLVAEDRIK